MLSGQRDVVVPPAHMQELWEIASKPVAVPDLTKGSKKNRCGKEVKDKNVENLDAAMVGLLARDGRLVKLPYGAHSESLFLQCRIT